MYLSRFGVKNYKCLGEIDIPLTPIHVLIGENDAGKTAVLEAMDALYGSSEKPLAQVFPAHWSGLELVRHAAGDVRIELRGEWTRLPAEMTPIPHSSVKYRFEVQFPPFGTNCVVGEESIQLDAEPPSVWRHRRGETEVSHWTRTGRLSEDVDFAEPWVLTRVLKPAHKYALNARMMAMPATIDSQRTFRLDADGFGLPTLLDDILSHQPELYIHLRDSFCELLPQFKTVRTVTEEAIKRSYDAGAHFVSSRSDGRGIRFETRSGREVRGEQASDGAILLLGFLALAHLPNPPTLLLVEEPENGVYPKRLGEVIKILKQMVHREEGPRFPQIILTTHSPFVLSFFQPEEVTFLSRPKDGPDAPVRARPLRDAPKIKERMGSEFYLGELWYNLSEEDLFGEP